MKSSTLNGDELLLSPPDAIDPRTSGGLGDFLLFIPSSHHSAEENAPAGGWIAIEMK